MDDPNEPLEGILLQKSPDMSEDDDCDTPLLEGGATNGSREPPKDKYLLTYWIMFLFGVGSLLPWNMFITAAQYFKAEVSKHPDLSDNFENYLIIAAQVPNVAFLFINAFFKNWLSERIRILASLCVMLAMMLLTTILAWLDSDSWQGSFFGITMVSVVFINVASAIFQGGVFGIVGKFPPRYRQAVMSGQGLGGTFAALANIFSLLGAGSAEQLTKTQLEHSAIGYFMSAVVVIIISIGGYMALQKLIWPMALSACLVFFVTLSVFPAVTATIRSVRWRDESTCNSSDAANYTDIVTATDRVWICTYFTPVTCFLLFNVMDFIGRTLPTRLQKPGPRYLLIPVVARLLFIPLYLFCKFDIHREPYFNSDLAPILLMVFMAVSNGYLGTLSFIYAPSKVKQEDGETAGALMAAFLGVGLLSGTLFSFLSARVMLPAVQDHMRIV